MELTPGEAYFFYLPENDIHFQLSKEKYLILQCRFALSLLIGGHFCLHSRNEHTLLRHCILRILLPLECFRMICHSTITQCLKSGWAACLSRPQGERCRPEDCRRKQRGGGQRGQGRRQPGRRARRGLVNRSCNMRKCISCNYNILEFGFTTQRSD